MHVVCFNMQEHYFRPADKPLCVRTNCASCGREIHVCAACKAQRVNQCEACATRQVLFEDQQAQYSHDAVDARGGESMVSRLAIPSPR